MEHSVTRDALVATLMQAREDDTVEITGLLRAFGLVHASATPVVAAIVAEERQRGGTGVSFARRVAQALDGVAATTPRAAEPDPDGRCAALQVRRFRGGLSRRRCGACAEPSIALWAEGQCPRCTSPRPDPLASADVTVCNSCASREPASAKHCERCGDGLSAPGPRWKSSPDQLRRGVEHVRSFRDDVMLVSQLHHDIVGIFEEVLADAPAEVAMLSPLADRLTDLFAKAGPAAPHVHLGPQRLWRFRRALWALAGPLRPDPEGVSVTGLDVHGRANRLLLALDAEARPVTIEEARAALRDAIACDLDSLNEKSSFSYNDDSMSDVLGEQETAAREAKRLLARHDGAGQTLARWLETLHAQLQQARAYDARNRLRGLWDVCPA